MTFKTVATKLAIALRQVFAAVEENGVILLFDEADALFGKRSEVKDSRDRCYVHKTQSQNNRILHHQSN